ncbi:hypothetical protein HDF11_001744 [Tunturiibacter psychrotolerans]|jgi:hypothetical protein
MITIDLMLRLQIRCQMFAEQLRMIDPPHVTKLGGELYGGEIRHQGIERRIVHFVASDAVRYPY